jgi:opacity protein-like surface antigen
MKKIYAAAFCCLILAPAHGLAADLGAFPSDSGSGGQQIVEIGTGWYIRGDVGVSLENLPTLSFNPGAIGTPPPASISPSAGTGTKTQAEFVGGGGVGYKFSNFIRADATFDYHSGSNLNSTTSGIICPYTASGLTSQSQTGVTGAPVLLGYSYNPNETCNAAFKLTQQNYTGLANAYFDLFTYAGFTPYVGAGAGINVQTMSGTLAYTKSSDGTPYRANLSPTGTYPFVWVNPVSGAIVNPQPAIAFAQQNWDRSYKTTNTNFAWALMGGVGVALTQNAMLDLSYRYLDMGSTSYTFNPQTGATVSHRNTAQEARIGIRYTPD